MKLPDPARAAVLGNIQRAMRQVDAWNALIDSLPEPHRGELASLCSKLLNDIGADAVRVQLKDPETLRALSAMIDLRLETADQAVRAVMDTLKGQGPVTN